MRRSPARSVLLALTVTLLLFAALTSLTRAPASADGAAIYYATPNGTGTACTRAAPCQPNAAVSKAAVGDSIYLAAGTFTGSGGAVISITKSLALLCGWNGSATGGVIRDPDIYRSVIDGQGQRRGIFILTSGPVGIDGCTIIRGAATMSPNIGQGGGILSASAVPLFTNNVISGCVGSNRAASKGVGGGIYLVNAPAGGTIAYNTLRDNRAATDGEGSGGAIALSLVEGLALRQNTLLHNAASLGGGVGYGGGLYIDHGRSVLVEDNQIQQNAGGAGSGAASGSNGGGVAILFSTYITLADNALRGNIAGPVDDGTGGAVSAIGGGGIWLYDNLIDDNTASSGPDSSIGRGGGVATNSVAGIVIERNTVVRNVASESGPGYGGAFYISRLTSFTLTNNLIAENDAANQGGALMCDTGGTLPVTGTLLHNTFAHNETHGSGQYAIHTDTGRVTLRAVNNLFYDNGCAVHGGPGADIILTRSLFFGNEAADTCGTGVVNQLQLTGLDPLLKSNLRLKVGSPAIDAGVDAGVSVDIDGDPRPFGSAPDIGADESTVNVIKVYLPVLGRTGG